MNIFVLDLDPVKSAEYHCDKHVIKMILESCQIISTVFDRYGMHQKFMTKPCFKNHPCTLWAGNSTANLSYIIQLGNLLDDELYKRYNKHHAFHNLLRWFIDNQDILDILIDNKTRTPFVLAMPDYIKDFYTREDLEVVKAYREYYIKEKAYFAKWRLGNVPYWFTHES